MEGKKGLAIIKKNTFLLILLFLLCVHAFGQEQAEKPEREIVPITKVFHRIGWNTLHSFTHNYGLNFIGAGVGTWIMIETGLDWNWNRLAYNNSWMPKTGSSANIIGYVVPGVTPIAFYLTGIAVRDTRMQITGLALTQSLMITLLIQTPLKIATGRTWPGIVDGWDSPRSRRSSQPHDYSREFNWFNLDSIGGWPSGHTANAFAAAATIAQIYHEKTALKIAVYAYASILGLGMSIYDHWASDVLAGALIGAAVGTTVGRSFRNLLEKKENNITFYATTNSAGIIIRI